jgi:hypothetical protein
MTRPHRSQYRTEPPGSLSERVYNVITDMSDAKSVLQELQAIVPGGPKLPLQPIIVAAQEEPGMFDSFEAYPWFLMVHRYDAPAPRPSCTLNSTSGSSAPQGPSFWSFGRRRFISTGAGRRPRYCPRDGWIPVPFPAPVGFHPNFLRDSRDREKAQLPQAFARQAWGFDSGTLRQIAL